MPVEVAAYVSELSVSDPPGTDFRKQGDDHLRLLKTVLKSSFPNASKAFYIPDYVEKTTTYAALASDQNKIIGVATAGGAWTLTLPVLAVGLAGWAVTIIKVDASANAHTIVPSAGTINGAASLILDTAYEFVEIMWNGTTWLAKVISIGAHTHAQADVTDLVADLALKASIASLLGKETIWLPAQALYPRTTNGCAALATGETVTNKVMRKSLDFDATTQEFAQIAIRMPKGWNEGTITFAYEWSHAATATNFGVAFALQAVALANDDPLESAFGTEQVAVDTGGTTDDVYTSPESAAITIAGAPAAEEYVIFQVKRVPADAADLMAIDARLHGITIYYTTDAATDS